jgi:tRNA (guanine-N7-)-methyltransferase
MKIKNLKITADAKAHFEPSDYFRRWSKQEIFGNDQPMEIDLGCGDGKFLLEMAAHFPQTNFLAVERLQGRVARVVRDADRAGLSNVRVLKLESLYTVEWLLEPGSVSRLHLLCPDPWPKAKHHRNRLVQRPFLQAVWDALEEGGEFLFKTDHEEYYDWACEQVMDFGSYVTVPWAEDDFFYPKTDFQLQWEAEGKTLQALRCQKTQR